MRCYIHPGHCIILSLLVTGGLFSQGLFARTVSLTLRATTIGPTLHLEGTANLPDHTLIEWELRHEDLSHPAGMPIELLSAEGHTAVVRNRFAADVNLSGWPKGKIEVWIAFQPISFGTPQPAFVTRLYGVYGEYLQGDNVSAVGGLKNMHRVELKDYVTYAGGSPGRQQVSGKQKKRPQAMWRPVSADRQATRKT